ncbi:MAG: hypothetical protein ACP5R5_05090 [Armatimonadota bacterium]
MGTTGVVHPTSPHAQSSGSIMEVVVAERTYRVSVDSALVNQQETRPKRFCHNGATA